MVMVQSGVGAGVGESEGGGVVRGDEDALGWVREGKLS
jgi:hypothetical protein